jgi:hypothetical protein
MPPIRGVQITGGFQVPGNQGGIFIGRCPVTRFDCGRGAPM